MTKSNFVTKLYDLRKLNNFSQAFVASKIGIDVNEYMNLENGNIPYTKSVVNRLATFYKVSYEQLVDDDKEVEFVKLDLEDSLVFQQQKAHKSYLKKIAVAIAFVVIVLLVFIWNFNDQESIMISNPNQVDASNNSVAYIDSYHKLFRQGISTTTISGEISKVCESDTNTLVLKNDNTVALLYDNKNSYDLEKYDEVSDIALGLNHLLLINDGDVICLGDNSFGQCEVADWENVNKVYANKNQSVGITYNNSIYVSGDIIDDSLVANINDAQDIAFSDKLLVYLNNDHEVVALNDAAKEYDLSAFDNVEKVVCGDDFIAALKTDQSVVIAIEDYLIIEAVNQWQDIVDIAASNNSLVAYDGDNVYGIGENTYEQFIKTSVLESTQLPAVTNIAISVDKNYVKISWDKVNNVVCYSVDVNTGTGYSTKVTNNYILIDANKFSDGQEYVVRIVSIGDNVTYSNSSLAEKTFYYQVYVEPTPVSTPTPTPSSEEIVIPTNITLEKLTGKLKFNFLAYMSGLGVSAENLIGEVDEDQLCEGNQEIILSVEGVEDNEELELSDLQSRQISYTYCLLPDEELPSETTVAN